MASEQQLLDGIEARVADVHIDIAARVQVYRRGEDDRPYAAEFLGDDNGDYVWGGRYSSADCDYVAPAENVVTFTCHQGHVALFTFRDPTGTIKRVLCLGAAGGGKTQGIALAALLAGIRKCHRTIGMCAPTGKRLKILWSKFLKICPKHWILGKPSKQDREIRLKNGTLYQFQATKKQSEETGVPVQGFDWHEAFEDEHQNISDEALTEIDLRGRTAGSEYRVTSSATNQLIQEFQDRLSAYKKADHVRVLTFSGYDNAFIATAWWESFRKRMSPSQFKRLIEGGSPPMEGLIYPYFDPEINIRMRQQIGLRNVTPDITLARFQRAYQFVVGHDFGQRVNASGIFEAWSRHDRNERIWWAIGEFVTADESGIKAHIPRLIKFMRERYGANPEDFIVVGDPQCERHKTNEGATETDYMLLNQAGIRAVKAVYGRRLEKRNRFGMVNCLLKNADDRALHVYDRHKLFIDVDADGEPACSEMVKSFKHYRWSDGTSGEPEQYNKDARDPSHYTDLVGYGLAPWEEFRGSETVTVMSPSEIARRN